MTPFEHVVAQLTRKAGLLKSGAAMVAVAALAGCAATPPAQDSKALSATPPLTVATEISKVAENINAEMKRLAEIEQISKNVKIPKRPKITSGPLAERITIPPYSWNIEEIVSKIADSAGYTYRKVGKSPPIPVMVKIDVEDTPVVDVLRHIGLEANNRATVNVDVGSKVIEVIYASDH